ncbi:hypothetical protein D3C73_1254280 [compost metagenome]
MLQQAVADILDIDGPLLHIFIVKQIEHGDKVIYSFFYSNLRRLVLALDNAADFTHEYRIVQNGEVRVEDTGFLRPDDLTEFFFDKLNLVFGGTDALV